MNKEIIYFWIATKMQFKICLFLIIEYLASISCSELFIYNENLEILKYTQLLGGNKLYFSKNDTKLLIYAEKIEVYNELCDVEIQLLNFDQNLTVCFKKKF